MSREDRSGHSFAYLVPANPHAPNGGPWATLVRRDPVLVGDRVDGVQIDVSADGGVTIYSSGVEWEVLAIEPTEDDGQPAPVRGWRGPNPIWTGRLVVRAVN